MLLVKGGRKQQGCGGSRTEVFANVSVTWPCSSKELITWGRCVSALVFQCLCFGICRSHASVLWTCVHYWKTCVCITYASSCRICDTHANFPITPCKSNLEISSVALKMPEHEDSSRCTGISVFILLNAWATHTCTLLAAANATISIRWFCLLNLYKQEGT